MAAAAAKGKGKKSGFRIGKYNGWVVVGAVGATILLALYIRSRSSSQTAQTQAATDPTGSTGAGSGGGDTSGGAGSAGGTTSSGTDPALLDALNQLTSVLGANGGILDPAAGFDPSSYGDPGLLPAGGPTWYTPGQEVGGPGGLSSIASFYGVGTGAGGTLTPKPTATTPVHTQKVPHPTQHVAPKRRGGGSGGGIRFPSTAKLGTAPTFHPRTIKLPASTPGGAPTRPGRQL